MNEAESGVSTATVEDSVPPAGPSNPGEAWTTGFSWTDRYRGQGQHRAPDRDLLLQKAREDGPFGVENSRVSMYPDYTAAVQARRASYTEVKKALWTEGIRYALLFPPKLKIMWDGHTHFCLSPEEAWSWLETHKTGTIDQKLHEPPPGQMPEKEMPLR
ncbi:hypothetical protein NDU88_004961 [Pleurodeles waltl]|uniref:Uncharacterized protein n=1 Tax=Pleurodeles waltl TaxID=8319 RepID=A0AAV7UKJ9_PLEWA|nr:hypothetical protein NDU88_004961 [Pleurodeles waltl]